jgi:hypothetical protein
MLQVINLKTLMEVAVVLCYKELVQLNKGVAPTAHPSTLRVCGC